MSTTSQPCWINLIAVARPTPLPAPVIMAFLFITSISRQIRNIDPPALLFREKRGIYHALGQRAFVEGGEAATLVANRVDKFKRLVVTEDKQRIALLRIAR